MTSTCEATTRVLPGAAVIELSGEVDGSAATVLGAAYEQAVTAGQEMSTVVLDFAAVDYINSTGIDITRLSDFIDLFPDLDRAVSQLTHPAA